MPSTQTRSSNATTERSGLLVEGLVKQFGSTTALDGLDLTVAPGELLGLLGPNGAGKTTTINVLSTLLVPDAGRAVVAGHDVVDEPEAVRRSISLTGQFAAVDDMLTGRENLVLFARLRGLDRRRAAQRGDELLDRLGLAEAADRRVGTYSGGMRRRLDLAASLVVPTRVLFLDEPTTGLDPRSRAELWAVVRELRREGITIVLTTQYLEEADQLADRIVVIDRGRVIASGRASELKGQVGGRSCMVEPADPGRLDDVARALTTVGEVSINTDLGNVSIADAGPDTMVEAISRLREVGIEVADVTLRRPTLDEVFLELTGGRG